MDRKPFIHLAVKTSHSLLESLITTQNLTAWCVEQAMPAIAVTDTNNMFGALEHSEMLVTAGVQPIMAAAFDVTSGTHQETLTRISLYAQNETGYRRLMALASQAWLDSQTGTACLHKSRLLQDTDGLLILTGGTGGAVGQHILNGKTKIARDTITEWATAYPGRCYVELTRHGSPEEAQIEPELLTLANQLGLPVVATHHACFMHEKEASAHAAMMCIANGTWIGSDDSIRVQPTQYLKTATEMQALFADLPDALTATTEIAMRCSVRAMRHDPILPKFGDGTHPEHETLRKQANEGLAARLKNAPQLYAPRATYHERLSYEIGVIERMGFSGYFLIVSDFIKWAKAKGIPVGPGRGSGAGSLVAWALLITDLDPLRFDLLFERFLNPERVSMPDFDIDFCPERRGEVIRHVRDKYGTQSVATIITFGTLQAKAVVRDVGRVMQMPYGQVDRLAKLIPFNPAHPVKLRDAIANEPRFAYEKEQDPRVVELLDTALALEGLYRNAGTHAAGLVIGDRPLHEIVPMYKDPRADLPATQFNMKWAEAAGLVKFDLLGLKTLTVIDRTLDFIRRDGRDVGSGWDNFDDEATYDLMTSGETLGVFQLEGQGMRDTLRKVRPSSLEDVIAIISLYRPGPMDNIPVYAAGKQNPETVRYQHPALKPILQATYGVPVYQEQVMRMAQEIAGYSLGEADLLRRAMGKKKRKEMVAQRQRFIDGAAKHKGINPPLANDIFNTMEKFAGYGFNKSHAAAYAVIGYQTAYLKRHFPVAFLAASMSLDQHNTDKLATFFQDARRLGIVVTAPDVNQSSADFDIKNGTIVYALGAIKGVGSESMRALVAERMQNGPFTSLHNLVERTNPGDMNKRCFEQLARSGGFDSLEPNRARVLSTASALADMCALSATERTSGQGGLFSNTEPAMSVVLPDIATWTTQERLDQELTAIGFYFNGHPLDDILDGIRQERITLAMNVPSAARDNQTLELIGFVRRCVEKQTRNGDKFAFLVLSDPTGEVELSIMPEILRDTRTYLQPGSEIVVLVDVSQRDDETRLSARRIEPLASARIAKSISSLIIHLSHDGDITRLAEIASGLEAPSGKHSGQIHVRLPTRDGRIATLLLPDTYSTSLQALRALKTVPGVRRIDCVTSENGLPA